MELKPCPFCGGSADVYYKKANRPYTKGIAFVQCDVCDAESGIVYGVFGNEEEEGFWEQTSFLRAREKWNTRTGG